MSYQMEMDTLKQWANKQNQEGLPDRSLSKICLWAASSPSVSSCCHGRCQGGWEHPSPLESHGPGRCWGTQRPPSQNRRRRRSSVWPKCITAPDQNTNQANTRKEAKIHDTKMTMTVLFRSNYMHMPKSSCKSLLKLNKHHRQCMLVFFC